MPKTGLTNKEFSQKALDKAEELICRFSADKFTLTDLARELDVSHAALYKYFPSKEAVSDSISKRWLDMIDNELEKISAANKSAEERIKAWFLALHRLKVKRIKEKPWLFDTFEKSSYGHKEFIEIHLKTKMHELTGMIKEGKSNGELNISTGAEHAASMLFEATLAYHYPKLVRDNINYNREQDLKKLVGVLLNGLRK